MIERIVIMHALLEVIPTAVRDNPAVDDVHLAN
jgi:hypothetical protein